MTTGRKVLAVVVIAVVVVAGALVIAALAAGDLDDSLGQVGSSSSELFKQLGRLAEGIKQKLAP